MWLINSSIGRKFVMSITGIALVLFLLFHGTMNFVAILSPESYNAIFWVQIGMLLWALWGSPCW